MNDILLENITHAYGKKIVLENLNINICGHKITCMLGGTGSGKTTILRLIAGLEQPVSGKIYIGTQKVNDGRQIVIQPYARGIGFVFQDLALWPHFTVIKNVAWGLKALGNKDADVKASSVLNDIGLSGLEKKYPHQLSGGQQQLLAMARALAPSPKILLMDEPLNNLDMKIKARMLDLVKEIKEKFDVTIVYVTHDPSEVFSIADNIIIINDNGKIEVAGESRKIMESNNLYVKELTGLTGSG